MEGALLLASTIWITGLPGAGKRALACALEQALRERGRPVARLDSGALRRELPELDFSPSSRRIQALHLAHSARQLNAQGIDVVVHAVSPYAQDREAARALLPRFYEVWLDTHKDLCVERGEQGRWAQALGGDLRQFTGVDAPYEAPTHAELVLRGELSQALPQLLALLEPR